MLAASSLPRWDLTDFYQNLDDPCIKKDITTMQDKVKQFLQNYQNQKNFSLTFEMVKDYESIQELMGKLISYAYLYFSTHVNDSKAQGFLQSIQEEITKQSSELVFFSLAINDMSDETYEKCFQKSSNLSVYRHWSDQVRCYKPYQLSSDLEKILLEKSVTGRQAWIRLFDETLAGISFEMEGKSHALEEILAYFNSPSKDKRASAAQALSKGLMAHSSLLTKITNVLAKDKAIEDDWRCYPHATTERNLSNQVEDSVVDTLIETVKENYANLSHRYYKLKAQWMGVDRIEYWDRNASAFTTHEEMIPYEEAKDIVLKAYYDFDPTLGDIAQTFFDRNWIDVPACQGKTSGAYSHPTVPSIHPYILLNYQGKRRDVMTLAHELGHGIHQVLAKDQGYLLSDTPLTIAETASVFGEMLTFQSLLKGCQTSLEKKTLIASKVEDMLNTVVRQIAFYDFEWHVHQKRQEKELSFEDIAQIWRETQEHALGSSVNLDPMSDCFWGYISHFIHSPFYVYAYAFGDCLVNSLYQLYQSQDLPNFKELYVNLLKAGGSKKHDELLKPFGFSLYEKAFWQRGLDSIKTLIDELERLD